jgi:uncharacterized protein
MIYLIILLIILLAINIFCLYLYRMVIDNRKTSIKPVGSSIYKAITTHSKKDADWLINHSKEITLTSFDGLTLHGYDANFKYDNYAILVHGYRGDGLELSRVAQKFYQLHFNILEIDLRGHGKSSGNYIGMGYDDSKDLLLWIKYLNKSYPHSKIILFGISMGAATVMMAAGSNPKNVQLVIEDAGYESIWEEFKYQIHGLFHLPIFPFLYLTSFITKLKAHYSFKDGDVINMVRKAKMPMLFIHGTDDTFINVNNAYHLYDAKQGIKEILIIPHARHVESEQVANKKYWDTINKFIKNYL